MKRTAALLLLPVLLLVFTAASAEPVAFPDCGFRLTLPDSFSSLNVSGSGDPTLCDGRTDGNLTMLVYRDYLGDVRVEDLFMVLTGDETESGFTSFAGCSMLYAGGRDASGDWLYYTWMDQGWNITVWFTWSPDNPQRGLAEQIMATLTLK